MLKLKIKQIIVETPDAKTFVLAGENISYKPGQFITFLFERKFVTERRSYSFSSSPDMGELPAITIKRTANGVISRWWLDEAKVNDQLTALEPAGVFTPVWQPSSRDIFLIAAGSGITPLFSILKSALKKEPGSKIHLVYSNNSRLSAIFYQDLLNLQKQFHAQLTIDWMFSDAQDLKVARLSTYNLQRVINERLVHGIKNALVYTCGPYDFMQMVQITSLTMGISNANFRRELFDINAIPPTSKRYFDTTDRTITITIAGTSFPILVKWNQTILQAAQEQGLNLPYNCGAGRCSNCLCKIVTGKIWMHYNEVLTEEDEANGYALTCTGHPVTEDLAIRI